MVKWEVMRGGEGVGTLATCSADFVRTFPNMIHLLEPSIRVVMNAFLRTRSPTETAESLPFCCS